MVSALVTGMGIGALAAANVGPIWLLCVRTSTRFGWGPGAAVGAGAATVDLAYATLGAVGVAALLRNDAARIALGVLGALVLVGLGLRTLRDAFRIRAGAEDPVEVVAPRDAVRTGIVATASNPLTILTWAAVFSGAAAADVAGDPAAAAAFVVGIGLGSLLLHLGLAGLAARAGQHLGPRALMWTDVASGVGLMGFGALLGVRTVRDS